MFWKHNRFYIYLIVIFLNAFTDLGHKIIIQNVLLKFYEGDELRIYTAIIQLLILIPFILVITPAGFLADKFPKSSTLKITAFLTIPITTAITVCYYTGAFWTAFALTFILALQSAFYSPAKYGYIRELMGKNQLGPANSAVQAITIVAILGSTIFYSIAFEAWYQPQASIETTLQTVKWAGFLLIAGSILEFWLAWQLPQTKKTNTQLQFSWGQYLTGKGLKNNLIQVWKNPVIWLSIIGLSLFWGVGQVVHANFGAYLKDMAGETDTRLINGILALAGIGIVLGSIYAGRASRSHIETGIIPVGILGMSIMLMLIPTTTSPIWLALICTIFGFFGGLFIVPLNALIQYHAEARQLGSVLSANNYIQNITMITFLLLAITSAVLNISHQMIFYSLAGLSLIGAIYTITRLPQSLVRYLLNAMLSRRYHIHVLGLNHLPSTGGVLLLGNHVSWLDWAILQIASPRPIRFVMLRSIYEKWYIRWFLDIFKVIPIASGASKNALSEVESALNNGEVVAIFPEGHISLNGHLGSFRSGFERAIKNTNNAVIVPFYLKGLWGTIYSYATRKYRLSRQKQDAKDLIIGFGKALDKTATADQVKQAVLKTSVHTWQQYAERLKPIPTTFIYRAKKDANQLALIDGKRTIRFSQLLNHTFLFAKQIKATKDKSSTIGILLPPGYASTIAILASWFTNKTIVCINYTAPQKTVEASLERAKVKTVLTSHQFLKKLEQKGFTLNLDSIKKLYLEDMAKKITPLQAITQYLITKITPAWLLSWPYNNPEKLKSTAAILFSSGSEGTPKGIQLSHYNIQSNIKQITAIINPDHNDSVLSTLPVFHAFGLTVTTLMPILEGIPMICHPDPTDAKNTAKLIAEHKVTLMFTTSTFLRFYIKNSRIHPLMLQSLRTVVAGAEKLNPEIRQQFKEKFGVEVFEGYGATETTPVASANLPDLLISSAGEVQIGHKPKTVGLPLPGTMFRIVDPKTLKELPTGEAGLILIGGPQVMTGYLNDKQKTDQTIHMQENIRWYSTGDKGQLDEDGFLTIIDRYARFAKRGGEMISLTTVEEVAMTVIGQESPDCEHLAIATPDSKKGEKITLLLADIDKKPADILKALRQSDIEPLLLPDECKIVESIPKLGTGKYDLINAKKLVEPQEKQ